MLFPNRYRYNCLSALDALDRFPAGATLIVTHDFVFVHVPKTGGMFVRELIECHYEVVWRSPEYHGVIHCLPHDYRQLPALSFVRNPWDWYVAQWAFMATRSDGRSRMHSIAKEGFEPFVYAAMERSARGGGYTGWFEKMTRGTEVGRFENLRTELLDFLRRYSDVSDPLAEEIENKAAVNTSKHAPYQTYYRPETQQLVAAESASIIGAYGYTFE